MTRKLYAIGDIHGCLDELNEMLVKIHENRGDSPATIVFLGDYVDRGPKSAQVLDLVQSLVESSTDDLKYVAIRGNHEDMFMEGISTSRSEMFLVNGGDKTIESYVEAGRNYREHYEFMCSLPIWYKEGQFVFVHACLPPGLEDWEHMNDGRWEASIIWGRSYVGYEGEHFEGVFVVHGHTPVREIVHTANQLDIDTGCVFGNKLTAVRLYEDRGFEKFEVKSSMPSRF